MARMHSEGAQLFRVLVGASGPGGVGFAGRPAVYGPYQTEGAARAQGTRAKRYRPEYVARVEATSVSWEPIT